MSSPANRLRARVENGRIVVNEPTDLPDGTILDLVVQDEGDDLDDEERKLLDLAIEESLRQAAAGQTRPASEIIDELRRRAGS